MDTMSYDRDDIRADGLMEGLEMCVYQFGSLQILRCLTENNVLRYFPIGFGCKHLKPLASYLVRFSEFEAYLRV